VVVETVDITDYHGKFGEYRRPAREIGLTSPASSSTSFRNAMRRTRKASSALLGSKLCLKQRSTKTSITPPNPGGQ
jgi:hypothetical protein